MSRSRTEFEDELYDEGKVWASITCDLSMASRLDCRFVEEGIMRTAPVVPLIVRPRTYRFVARVPSERGMSLLVCHFCATLLWDQ